MSNHVEPQANGISPFDAIKSTRPDGSEYWSARDLMPMLGYGDKWQNFAAAIDRAKIAAEVQGHNVENLFTGVSKKGAGRPQQDFELARFACYLVAMNGDPRKPEIAAAMAYFAIQTHVAETRQSIPALPGPRALAQMVIEAEDRAELEAARARELEPAAKSWENLAAPGGDFSVAQAAKVLSRDPAIEIGRNRLFDYLAEIKWIFKTKGKRAHWEAYQPKVDAGLLSHKLGGRFINEQTEEWEQANPTVRITARGLHELHKRLGGAGPVLLVA